MPTSYILKAAVLTFAAIAVIGCAESTESTSSEEAELIGGLGLTEQDVVESYIYAFPRYLVIRQEHTDLAEEGVEYNVLKLNELGKAEFVNPNLDVAYLEAWFAVDEDTPVVLEIPRIEGRYYTAQLCDEWAEIITNINERNYPDHPYGRYALCLAGSDPQIPEGAVRIDLPSKKAKMLARVERKGDDQGALALQRQFRIIKTGEPEIKPALDIPMFTNAEPLRVEVFDKPMIEKVLASAPDSMVSAAPGMQKKVMAIADFVAESEANRTSIDAIVRTKAFPALVEYIKSFGDKRGGWSSTRELVEFGDNMWFRCAANYAGIWWNSSREVVYYIGEQDQDGEPLHGDHAYVIHFAKEDLPQDHVNAYWSLTLMSLPDYRVVPNELNRFNLNNQNTFAYEDDGSLKVYLSGTLPEGAPQQNWLPAPKGSPFTLNLRMYVVKEEVLTGEYYVPPLERVN
jgi:hypothetical protein